MADLPAFQAAYTQEGAAQQGWPQPRGGATSASTPLQSSWHAAFAETKGEDVSIVREGKAFSSGVSFYAVADGHNGSAAAQHVSMALPQELERQLGSGPGPRSETAICQALARTFVATNDAVCKQFFCSGCTLTAAVLSGDVLTIANVGDSKAMLDTGAELIELTTEHRIGQAPSEFARLEQAGGRLARLNEYGSGPSSGASDGIGPVRLWPGGIMVSRAVGDRDVGDILLPNPSIRQIRLPPTGARLIIASDGLWDAVPAGRVARMLRQHGTAKAAATQAVNCAVSCRGGMLSDDVTVVIVDLLPPGCPDFKAVCAQFKGRARSMLLGSTPSLSTLSEAAPAQQQKQQQKPAPAPRRSGLFACFSKPDVRQEASSEEELSASRSTRSGYTNLSNSGFRGGSEKSMRGGVVRDPSVRGCQRATSVEVLCEADTAFWTAADFGRAPSLSTSTYSSSSSAGAPRGSPRGVVDGLPFGLSLASMTSEEDTPGASDHHSQASSMGHKAASFLLPLSRKSSPAVVEEKKCHGGNAAAALLTLRLG